MIARQLEARGISTVCLSSAWSITEAVQPPRAVYVDYPLGHTAGKPNNRADQQKIMLGALQALETVQVPGTIRDLQRRWSEDETWKDRVMRPRSDAGAKRHADDRVERWDTPQYHRDDDADQVEANCPSCVYPTLKS